MLFFSFACIDEQRRAGSKSGLYVFQVIWSSFFFPFRFVVLFCFFVVAVVLFFFFALGCLFRTLAPRQS